MFEARERDLKVQKDNVIAELQTKIRALENNGESLRIYQYKSRY